MMHAVILALLIAMAVPAAAQTAPPAGNGKPPQVIGETGTMYNGNNTNLWSTAQSSNPKGAEISGKAQGTPTAGDARASKVGPGTGGTDSATSGNGKAGEAASGKTGPGTTSATPSGATGAGTMSGSGNQVGGEH